MDGFYKLVKFTPIKLALAVLKETQRTWKVHHGVLHAAKLYPQSYVMIVAVGTAKGQLVYWGGYWLLQWRITPFHWKFTPTPTTKYHVVKTSIVGAGNGIMKTIEQLVRGVWIPTGNEMLRPSL
jgi:hypothetical protein